MKFETIMKLNIWGQYHFVGYAIWHSEKNQCCTLSTVSVIYVIIEQIIRSTGYAWGYHSCSGISFYQDNRNKRNGEH